MLEAGRQPRSWARPGRVQAASWEQVHAQSSAWSPHAGWLWLHPHSTEGIARPKALAAPARLTTRPSTSVRTRSPISREMSLPNCRRAVRNRLSLLSCRAPQAGGRCCVDREAVDEVAGPLLKPLGVDGAPLMAVGEWLLPFITAGGRRV